MRAYHKIYNFIFSSIAQTDRIIPVIYIPWVGVITMFLTMLRIKIDHKRKEISDEYYRKSMKNLIKGLLLTFILTLVFMALLESILKYLNLID